MLPIRRISCAYGYAPASAFCAVVERKSFSQAAERLGVTQPAVSLQVRASRSGSGTSSSTARAAASSRPRPGAALPERPAAARSRGPAPRRARRGATASSPAGSRSAPRPGPAAHLVPLLLCEFARRTRRSRSRSRSRTRRPSSTGSPTASSSSASSARCGATARSTSSRSPATRSCSPCPPGHASPAATCRLDELRARDAPRHAGGRRRPAGDRGRAPPRRAHGCATSTSRLELGLQESVKSAVAAGYGVAFISRTAVEAELAAGTLAAARVAGVEPARELYARPPDAAAPPPAPPRRSSRSRGSRRSDRPLGARRASRPPRRARNRAAPPRDEPALDLARTPRREGSTASVARPRLDSVDGRDRGGRGATGSSRLGGGSAIDTGKAVSAATGLRCLRPDDVLRRRVDASLRDARRGARVEGRRRRARTLAGSSTSPS